MSDCCVTCQLPVRYCVRIVLSYLGLNCLVVKFTTENQGGQIVSPQMTDY